MQLIACSVLLLVILGESCCNTTTVNQTSTSWGYDYSETDTSGFKVKHDHDKGYQLEPMSKNTSSGLKKYYNSSSVYDQFTSPGANMSISQSNATSDGINGTSIWNTGSRANSTVLHKVLLDTTPDGEQTTEFRTLPIVKTQTQTGAPTEPNVTAKVPLSPSQGTVFGNINGSSNVPASTPLYKATHAVPYSSQNFPVYRALTGPMYPQAPTYGQTYGPVGGSMYGIPNGQMYMPPPEPLYGSAYGQPTGPMYGPPPYRYGPQNGQMYGPQNGQIYGPQNGQIYGPHNGQMNEPQNGQMNGPQNGQMYGPQNSQMNGPQNGQMYGPKNGQTYGYPTGSLYVSYGNY